MVGTEKVRRRGREGERKKKKEREGGRLRKGGTGGEREREREISLVVTLGVIPTPSRTLTRQQRNARVTKSFSLTVWRG